MTDISYPTSLTNGLSRNEILALLKNRLDEERYNHCLRVETTARELAKQYDQDIDRAGLAGLLHDYGKQIPVKTYRETIERGGYDPVLLQYDRGVWHGLVGTWFIQGEVGITDRKVLQAIERHTTGDPAMTVLDQLIFVADFIEPARALPSEIKARDAAKHSIEEATLIELESSLQYLVSERKLVYPATLLTYNAFVQKLKE